MPKSSAERVAEYRARKALEKSGTPKAKLDTGEVFGAEVARVVAHTDETDALLDGLDAPLKKELADLEERVKWARLNALPPSRNPQGELIETQEDVQDRAEAYARWRYESWKEGKTSTPY